MKKILVILLMLPILGSISCSSSKSELISDPNSIENTYGYTILNKLKGIWAGPVTSTTALGNYSKWIVDFRPISENHIAAKNELDKLNDIFMSFFIVKYNNEYRVAFRNGGTFNGMQRVSYLIADSISESNTKSYYRFSEIIKGKKRAYSEVLFKNDSLYIKSYTNQYNSLTNPSLHMSWSAKIQDQTASQPATSQLGFPSKTMTKDFSNTFNGISEAMYFSTSGAPTGDPFPVNAFPFLGQLTASYTYDNSLTPDGTKKVFLIVSTQSLFPNGNFSIINLKYISRTVVLSATDSSYTFNYMHPGNYYIYAVYDGDGNSICNSGDWISSVSNNNFFTLSALEQKTFSLFINFVIP
jgi:hypothetical protein